jgi:hypothetical protein
MRYITLIWFVLFVFIVEIELDNFADSSFEVELNCFNDVATLINETQKDALCLYSFNFYIECGGFTTELGFRPRPARKYT